MLIDLSQAIRFLRFSIFSVENVYIATKLKLQIAGLLTIYGAPGTYKYVRSCAHTYIIRVGWGSSSIAITQIAGFMHAGKLYTQSYSEIHALIAILLLCSQIPTLASKPASV